MREMQEIWVPLLDQGKSPGIGNGNPPQDLASKSPWTQEPGGYSPWSYKELDTAEHAHVVKYILRP